MSMSHLEAEFTRGSFVLKRRISKMWCQAVQLKADLRAAFHEVTSSPDFRPAAFRVTTSLAVGFGLVQIAKHLLS